jgi:membrane protein implicated in regulation of membrane protease activity
MWITAGFLLGLVGLAVVVGAHLGPHVHLGAGVIGILAAVWLVYVIVDGRSAAMVWALLGVVLVVSAAALIIGWYGLSGRGTVDYHPHRMEAAEGVAVGDLEPDGLVRVRGEQWHATSVNGTARAGTRVQVLRRTGLHLEVWAEEPEAPAADRDPGGNGRGSTWS